MKILKEEFPTRKYTTDTTMNSDLARLIGAGWDVNALVAREAPRPFGKQLGQAAHRLAANAKAVKAGSK